MLVIPFLKWVGGKTQIMDKIFQKFPPIISYYYEPFTGGGSVLLNLLNEIEQNKRIVYKITSCDINKDLIQLYETIKYNVQSLINILTIMKVNYDEAQYIEKEDGRQTIVPKNTIEENIAEGKQYVYYYYRNQYNLLKKKLNITNQEIITKSALFIFLNKTCFRGVYRENSSGTFNVPFGNYKKVEIFNSDNLTNISLLFNKHNVIFKCCDFNEIKKMYLDRYSFIYLDPPYYPENETSFTSYTANDFDKERHIKLIKLCHYLNSKAKFLLSNSNTDFIKDKLNQYHLNIILCKRAITSNDPGATTNEILIYN